MEYKILGETVPCVEINLTAGESMFTQSGGMAWQTNGIQMSTNVKGGVLKGIGRMFAGESLFMATYHADQDSMIAFASTVPGTVKAVNVTDCQGLTIQKGAFLCAQSSVTLETTFTKKVSAGFFGGEGFILQRLSGSGLAFLEIDGDSVEKELASGEVLKVDTGNVVAFDSSVSYEIETVKGLGNIFFGGEGLFLTKLTGPGRVILQTQNFPEFAGRINALAPKTSN
ncbi:MAG: TIGR00266 family protein [Lachnospiraceae bacterium]|nr:TIGR00266 family protein [Lachnospiraceae bacterium]